MTYQIQNRRLFVEVYDDAGVINRGLELIASMRSMTVQPLTPEAYLAAGNDIANDTAAWANFVAGGGGDVIKNGAVYRVTSAGLPINRNIIGRGANLSTIKRSGSGNLINAANVDGARISGVTLDVNRTERGNISGHGISASGSSLRFEDIIVRDYGSTGVGGGTGILVMPGLSGLPKNIRLSDSDFFPDQAAAITVGWIFEDSRFSFASRLYAEGVVGGIGYAHELKDDARHNSLDQLVAEYCNVGLAYGQTTVGIDGADYNVATNLVFSRCDRGLLIGEGIGNVTVGMTHVADGSPANTTKRGVSYSGGASRNWTDAAATFGTMQYSVHIDGDLNVAEVASHDTATNVVYFGVGSTKNFVRVVHPGARTSILGAIDDASGIGIASVNANVVRSDVTGERVGSISGRFWDKLGVSGIVPPSSHGWVYEGTQFVFQSLLTAGNSGDIAGTSVSTARDGANTGRLWHVTGATIAENYWTVAVGETADVVRIYNSGIRIGPNGPRWLSGAGTPEGVVTAPVGSFFSRTNGGANTTFYVKESGAGNTGWIAK